MHDALASLLDALRLSSSGEGCYEAGHPGDDPRAHLFGGQVLAQGLAAAHAERGDAGLANSLHATFLNRGNASDPLRFEVRELRRSRAFQSLQVGAHQNEQPLLHMTVTYHDEEEGLVHQIPMDDVGPPSGEGYERALLQIMTPDGAGDDTPFELPVEIRGVGGVGLFDTEVRAPQVRCWLRVRGVLPESPRLHQLLFAYASDYAIMMPALNPHPITIQSLITASLDHAIWFHRPFRMDEWLLFELDSPAASGARGIGRGLLYTRKGELVASCVQEALLRPLRAEGEA